MKKSRLGVSFCRRGCGAEAGRPGTRGRSTKGRRTRATGQREEREQRHRGQVGAHSGRLTPAGQWLEVIEMKCDRSPGEDEIHVFMLES